MTYPLKLHDHIEKLRVLNYVGRTGSITQAASLLHITQAAASHSIRVLETVLDIKLMHREARGIRLTESGKILFEFSQRLLADVQNAEARALNPFVKNVGALRVGTHETLAVHVWPAFLSEFYSKHPQISVSLISGRVDALVQGLLKREYQIVVTVEPMKHRDIQNVEIYSGNMGLFVGPESSTKKHPILKKSSISMAEANKIAILTDAAAHIRQNLPIPVFLLEQGFNLDQFYELNSFEAAMRIAMVGNGIAVVPERNAAAYVKEGLLRPLKIKGIDAKKFGSHRICASVIKEEFNLQPIVRTFFEEVTQFCKPQIH